MTQKWLRNGCPKKFSNFQTKFKYEHIIYHFKAGDFGDEFYKKSSTEEILSSSARNNHFYAVEFMIQYENGY